MHIKHDAARSHPSPPAGSPDRSPRSVHGPADSAEHPPPPGNDACRCVVCEQLRDADTQYFGRVLRNGRARIALAQTLALGMGFCRAHAALATELHGPAAAAVQDSIRDAGRLLGDLLDRTALQDELIQDIVFGARGRCPACAYFHRVEGRVLARVQRELEQRKPFSPPPVCFVHLQSLKQRVEPPLLGRIKRLLRARSRGVLGAIDRPGAFPDAGIAQACLQLYPLELANSMSVHAARCACPICEDIALAQRRWLGTAIDNVRLRQPGWIALPTCHRHLLQCIRQPDRALQHAALARYFEVALPGKPETGHSWAYLPDLGRAFEKLAWHREQLGRFERFHFAGNFVTGAELAAAVQKAAPTPLKVASVPWALLRLIGLVNPLMREIVKMRYLWQNPMRLADPRLDAILGPDFGTPYDDAIAATVKPLLGGPT